MLGVHASCAGPRLPNQCPEIDQGFKITFDHPVCLFLKGLVGLRGFLERDLVCREGVHSQRILVGQQGKDVVDPALDVRLAHVQADLLVEHRQHRQRIGGPSVDPRQRDRSATPDDVDRRVEGSQPVDAGLRHRLARNEVRQQANGVLDQLIDQGAVRLHADGVDHRVRAQTAGDVADRVTEVVDRIEIDGLDAAFLRPRQPFRDPVDADHARPLM